MAAARFVICRLAIHPTRALFHDAQFTQKTMQWQHYDLFAQLVDSSTIAQHDLSEYGMNLRLMTVPWRVVHEVLEAGNPRWNSCRNGRRCSFRKPRSRVCRSSRSPQASCAR